MFQENVLNFHSIILQLYHSKVYVILKNDIGIFLSFAHMCLPSRDWDTVKSPSSLYRGWVRPRPALSVPQGSPAQDPRPGLPALPVSQLGELGLGNWAPAAGAKSVSPILSHTSLQSKDSFSCEDLMQPGVSLMSLFHPLFSRWSAGFSAHQSFV